MRIVRATTKLAQKKEKEIPRGGDGDMIIRGYVILGGYDVRTTYAQRANRHQGRGCKHSEEGGEGGRVLTTLWRGHREEKKNSSEEGLT